MVSYDQLNYNVIYISELIGHEGVPF